MVSYSYTFRAQTLELKTNDGDKGRGLGNLNKTPLYLRNDDRRPSVVLLLNQTLYSRHLSLKGYVSI